MATKEQVSAALFELLGRTRGNETTVRSAVPERRMICCKVPDLDAMWYAEIADGHFSEPSETPPETKPDITLTVASDDLVGLVEGEVGFMPALASGRLRIDASFADLMRLRGLLG